jgi:hypothetical protein
MLVPRKYQFKLLVNLKLLDLLGTLMMETTSLNDTTCSTVTTSIIYKCPESSARKNPPIMMKVHIVRVMNVCFFFS